MRKDLDVMPIQLSHYTRHRIERGEPAIKIDALPMGMFATSDAAAQWNHNQSCRELQSRGGVNAREAVAILSSFHIAEIGGLSEETCMHILVAMEDLWTRGMSHVSQEAVTQQMAAE